MIYLHCERKLSPIFPIRNQGIFLEKNPKHIVEPKIIQLPVTKNMEGKYLQYLEWSKGEIETAKWLISQQLQPLQKDGRKLYRIWSQVELLQGDKRTDFIVFLDEILIIIEVKGHQDIGNVNLPSEPQNPWKQCREYVDEIHRKAGGYLPITGIVLFPFIKKTKIGEKIKNSALINYKIGTIFQNELNWQQFIQYAKEIQLNSLENPNPLCALYQIIPDAFAKKLEKCIPEVSLYALEQEQLAIAKNPNFTGDRIIYGVAGSGKTFILINRVKTYLSMFEKIGFKILILCYNKPLQVYLQNQFNTPAVEVRTIHAWFRKVINQWNDKELNQKLNPNDENYFQNLTQVFKEGIEKGLPVPQYEQILIDEGQDFDKDWIKLVRTAYKQNEDSLFAIYLDGLQAVHKRKKNKFKWKEVGIAARGRTKYLRKNYRNPQRIGQYAVEQAKNLINNLDAQPDEPDFVFLPEGFGRLGGMIIESKQTRKTLPAFIATLLNEKTKNQNAMIIIDKIQNPNQLQIQIQSHLNRLNTNINVIYTQKGKSPLPYQNIVPILTPYRSKGLEADLVLFVHTDMTPVSLKYVAITRAIQTLAMIKIENS